MNPRGRALAWTAFAVAAGIGIVLVVRAMGNDPNVVPDAVQDTALEEPAGDATASGADPASAVYASGPAPWERSGAARADTRPHVAADGALPAIPAPFDASAQVATIRSQSKQNLALLDDLVDEIDVLEKSGRAPADMQLGNLRENLDIARRAQLLALELAESMQQPDTPARRQRTEAIVAELQHLRSQLHDDVAGLQAPGRAQ